MNEHKTLPKNTPLIRKRSAFIASLGVAALVLSGCFGGGGSGSSTTSPSGTASGGTSDLLPPVASNVNLPNSAVFEAMKKAGKVKVGTKPDIPGLSELSAVDSTWSGFDVDIAYWISGQLGFKKDQVEFVAIPNAAREQALINGQIDMYVGSYSITDKRKEQISFAGPYLETGQGLLVLKSSPINSDADLDGKKVCATTGSTAIQRIKEKYPKAVPVELRQQAQCTDQLIGGQVDVVSTDEAILAGVASVQSDKLKLVGKPFSEELYGIGLKKDESALRHYINGVLSKGQSTLEKIYKATLGKVISREFAQPKVDDYS